MYICAECGDKIDHPIDCSCGCCKARAVYLMYEDESKFSDDDKARSAYHHRKIHKRLYGNAGKYGNEIAFVIKIGS